MAELTIEQAKRIYRIAVDATMSDDQGADWWDKVVTEMRQVCAARSVKEGLRLLIGGTTTGHQLAIRRSLRPKESVRPRGPFERKAACSEKFGIDLR